METTINETIAALKQRSAEYEKELHTIILSNQNCVVEVGKYTISNDNVGKGKTKLEMTVFPTLWTEQMANEIARGKFTDKNGQEIKAKVFFYRDWYKKRIQKIKECIDILEYLKFDKHRVV